MSNDQLDGDLDGFGNRCDGDFDGDGRVRRSDFRMLARRFGCRRTARCWDAQAEAIDLDGNSRIGWRDLRLFIRQLRRGRPGPSGLSCAGQTPCTPPVPIKGLPVVQVRDLSVSHPRKHDQADIDLALEECQPGCNLLFLARVYDDVAMQIGHFPDGVGIFGYRDSDAEDETVLRSPLFYTVDHAWEPLIRFLGTAPDGMVLQDVTLDGRKHEQLPPVNRGGRVLTHKTGNSTGVWSLHNGDRLNGVIRRVESRDFAAAGLSIANMPGWTIADNYVSGIGCNQRSEPCGDRASPPAGVLNWDDVSDAGPTEPPGNKLRSGIGIVVLDISSGSVLERNHVERAMKIGIEVFGGSCTRPTGESNPVASRSITIADNVVRDSRNGIGINGGCGHLIEGNEVYGSFAEGVAPGAVFGHGYKCGLGSEITWRNNLAQDNERGGFGLACAFADDLLLEGNRSINNCTRSGSIGQGADLGLYGGFADDGIPRPDGVIIRDFTATGGRCGTGIDLLRRTNVSISDSSIEGGSRYGIAISESSHVLVETTTITSSQPPGAGDVGIFFNRFGGPPTNPSDDMRDVYVHTSTLMEGFDVEARFEAPLAPNAGNDVAYCAFETSPPAGCNNGS